MSFQCLNPLVAVNLYTKNDGKQFLKFLSPKRLDYNLGDLKLKYGEDNVYTLPCGTCESCRRNKAEDWAIRCTLEAKMHQFNYFVTLTYDDFHISKAGYEDLRAFLDRLSGKNHKNKYKYFACLEEGELTQRKHFHLVLFCDFSIDLFKPVKIGSYYHYESDLMSKLWTFGFYTISPFQTTCARYVAKYTAKNSKLFMSRNLGKSYFDKYYQEIIKDGFKVYGDFGNKYSAYVPHCFLRWFEELEPGLVDGHKKFKRSIAHLVMCEKRRNLVSEHEEDVIKEGKNIVIEKGKVKRKL